MGDLNDTTWQKEKYAIDRVRRDMATASPAALRTAIGEGLDMALRFVAAHDRDQRLDLYDQAFGATQVTGALAQGLESGRES